MIPKRIITTWVCNQDHGTYRERDKRRFYACLESWHRLMPDYDIRIVSEANILDYGQDDWIVEQLRRGNGIGASQWARVFWLYQLGGVYVDMDQEAVQRFDSLLTQDAFFCGHLRKEPFIGNGIIGAPAGHPILMEQVRYLCGLDVADPQFGNESGPRMLTKILHKSGWKGGDQLATVGSGPDIVTVYPHQVFYPYSWKEPFSLACIRPETIAVHHWASSWDQHDAYEKPVEPLVILSRAHA